MKNTIYLLAVATAFLNVGCDAQKAAVNDLSTTAVKNESVSPNAKTGVADVTDACKILPKEEVEKIVGEAVSDAKLELINADKNTPAQFLLCTYNLANARAVKFFARLSEEAENTPENIAKIRQTNGAESDLKTEDVPELGAGAFWAFAPPQTMPPVLDTLHAFKGEKIYVYVIMKNPKSATEGKAQAIKIAQASMTTYG